MQLFANNAKTTVSSTLSPSSTSLVVLDASKLPTIDIGDYYLLTLEKADRTALEIVKVTGAVGNTLTIIRAQEGTSSIEFPIDSIAELRLTAEYLNNNTEKLDTIEYGAQVNTVTPDNVVTLTNKTLDSSTNKIGADSIHYKVKNMTGSTILPGTVVKVDGYEAGEETIRITPTTNTNDVAIGITKSSILHGEIGLVVNTGIASGINTTTYTTGTILYQNGSGGLTVTKPSSETYQAVAVAMNSKVDGSLLVEFSEPVKVNWDDRYYTETEINNTLTSYTRSGDTVQLTGDVTGSATVAADGSISVATTISANSVALGTDTTGNYVASLVAGTGITVGAAGEGATPTITNSAPNVTTDISITHNASTVVVNSSDGTDGTINAATTTLAGVMSGADKAKLDGIASGANNYSLPTASATTLGGVKVGANLSIDASGVLSANDTSVDWSEIQNKPTTYYTLPQATSTILGGVELFSDTVQTVAANAVTATASRTYGVQVNSAGQAVVNVPWVDTNTVYTHPTGDGNLHVPATGTTNAGKVLTAGATAGSLSWGNFPVTSVAGRTGDVTISKSDVGLSSVDNTADAVKNVLSATKLATARTIELTGDVTGSATFDGSANASITATIVANSVTLGTDTTGNYVAGVTAGTDISVTGTAGEGWSPTIAVNSATANTASTIVKRDASGNFSAGTITATLSGNASTATTLQTARTIATSGDVTGTATSFNGSANITIPMTLANSGVTAGTYNNSATTNKPITVDSKGRITAVGTDVTITPAWTSITDKPNTISGYGITDAYTKTETDNLLQGLKPKSSVKVATTANITLSGTQTIDGVAVVVGDRVLVKNQSTGSGNGIYVVASGSWTRSVDADTATEITAAYVMVEQGSTQADTGWVCTTDNITLGTTSLTFVQFSGSGAYQAVITGAASSVTSSNLTSSMALVSDASGKITTHGTVSATELGYLNGVTGAIQTQLNNKASTNIATTSTNGLMSAADKTKLNGIASGAEVNQNAFSSIAVSGQTTVDADSKTDTLTLASGTGIYITTNATTDTITLTNTSPDQVVTLTGSGATSVTGTYPNFTISSTNTTYGLATSTVAGLVELVSDTVQTTAANAVTSTTGRTYGSQLNSAGQLVVNVPWTDTVYTHPTSGVTAGTYKSVTVDANGHVTSGSNPNTLAGYGITDAATSTHTHGDISNTGTITSTAVTPANTDYILISDTSASGAIKRGISIGTSTTTFLRNDGTWQTATANTGTVTSVSLSLPGMFTVSGSPVTTSGTLTAALASQTANTIFAAPSGSAGVPSFRSLVATDIPSLDASKLTTGTLGTARGGTGLTSFTQGGVLYASSTSALASSAAGTAGQVLTSNGTGAPSWTTINAGATISNDTTTNATYYPVFATATTGNLTSAGVSSSKLQYNPSTGTLTATNMDSLSDATLKDNVHGLSYGIQEVMAARPVSYTWKDSEEKSFGFIAQELEEIFPEAVHTTADGLKTVNYPILTAVLFNAVKSLKLELMELKAQNK